MSRALNQMVAMNIYSSIDYEYHSKHICPSCFCQTYDPEPSLLEQFLYCANCNFDYLTVTNNYPIIIRENFVFQFEKFSSVLFGFDIQFHVFYAKLTVINNLQDMFDQCDQAIEESVFL